MKQLAIIDILKGVLIKYEHGNMSPRQAINEYKEIFIALRPAMASGVKAKDISTYNFKVEMVDILVDFELNIIDIYDAVDKIIDCFTTPNEVCSCNPPLVRTSAEGGEYCGLCEKDLSN